MHLHKHVHVHTQNGKHDISLYCARLKFNFGCVAAGGEKQPKHLRCVSFKHLRCFTSRNTFDVSTGKCCASIHCRTSCEKRTTDKKPRQESPLQTCVGTDGGHAAAPHSSLKEASGDGGGQSEVNRPAARGCGRSVPLRPTTNISEQAR